MLAIIRLQGVTVHAEVSVAKRLPSGQYTVTAHYGKKSVIGIGWTPELANKDAQQRLMK